MSHLLFLALKTLLFRRGSFILLLVAISGALGLQIANSANLDGYSQELLQKGVVNAIGHIVVSAREPGPLRQRASRISRLTSHPLIATIAPRYTQPAVLFHHGLHHPINAVGLDPEAEERANRFCSRIGTGRCFSTAATHELIVGHLLAEELKLAAGDTALLVLPFEDLDGVRYVRERFTVVGVMAPSGGFSILELGAFVRLGDLSTLLAETDAATALHLYLRDGERTAQAVPLLAQALGVELRVRPWPELSSGVSTAIKSMHSVNHISQLMVSLAIVMPTLALLWINVIREQRQIAALLAIGFTRRALFAVYLLRAALVGLFGVALGLGAGLILCRYFHAHPIYQHNGFIILPVLHATSAALSVALALLLTILGGIAPAIRAAFANPALALRGS